MVEQIADLGRSQGCVMRAGASPSAKVLKCMLSWIRTTLNYFFAFNTQVSRAFGRAIGLANSPHYIDASSPYFADAIKYALATVQQPKDDQPLVVLDVGCGRASCITDAIKNQHPCFLYGMDLSAEELDLNDALDGRIVYDACNGRYEKDLASYANTFDLIVSHTFLEHVSDPETTHRLLAFLLKDTGMVVHLYPTLFDPFLTLNYALPDQLTKSVLMILQPSRTETGKFPSYYKYCKACSPGLQLKYKELGFDILDCRNFYGTHYLYRFFPLQALMDLFYLLVMKLDARLFSSRSCVILVKDKKEGRGA